MEVPSILITTDAKGNITTSIEISQTGKTMGFISVITKNTELNKHIERAIVRSVKKYNHEFQDEK